METAGITLPLKEQYNRLKLQMPKRNLQFRHKEIRLYYQKQQKNLSPPEDSSTVGLPPRDPRSSTKKPAEKTLKDRNSGVDNNSGGENTSKAKENKLDFKLNRKPTNIIEAKNSETKNTGAQHAPACHMPKTTKEGNVPKLNSSTKHQRDPRRDENKNRRYSLGSLPSANLGKHSSQPDRVNQTKRPNKSPPLPIRSQPAKISRNDPTPQLTETSQIPVLDGSYQSKHHPYGKR